MLVGHNQSGSFQEARDNERPTKWRMGGGDDSGVGSYDEGSGVFPACGGWVPEGRRRVGLLGSRQSIYVAPLWEPPPVAR